MAKRPGPVQARYGVSAERMIARRLMDYWNMSIFSHPFPGDAQLYLPRLFVGLYHHELSGLPPPSVGDACKKWMNITHPSTVSKFITLAVEAGYLEKMRDNAKDKRKSFLRSTDKLRSEFKSSFAGIADDEREFFAVFNMLAPTGDGRPEFKRSGGEQNDDANPYMKEISEPQKSASR